MVFYWKQNKRQLTRRYGQNVSSQSVSVKFVGVGGGHDVDGKVVRGEDGQVEAVLVAVRHHWPVKNVKSKKGTKFQVKFFDLN